MKKGLVHIYTGEGKGKTTAAVGLAVRAKSRGLNTFFAQFFKEKNIGGETLLLNTLDITTVVFDQVKSPFFHPSLDQATLRNEIKKALSSLTVIFRENKFDVMILDEFICLISTGLLSEKEALAFLKSRPKNLEIVLTGRGASPKLMNYADYITYMQKIKHPKDEGITARRGIEI
jgi:cob(I)alamin adenosyltransferase